MTPTARVLATVAATAALALAVPAGPAQAATTGPTATLACDAATNTITASVVGNNWPRHQRQVTFAVINGSYATATQAGRLPHLGSSRTVDVPLTTRPVWSARDLRPWPAADYLFHTETVRITVKNKWTGAVEFTADRSCVRDVRTTYLLDCDAEAHTRDIRAAGTRYPGLSQVEVRYYWTHSYSMPLSGDPGFEGWGPGLVRSAVVPVAADGTWSDPGFSGTSGDAYYAYIDYRIDVRQLSGLLIGRGEGRCTIADHRPAG